MSNPSILSLIQNAALLLMLILLFDLLIGQRKVGKSRLWHIILGVFIGLIGVILMMTPWVMLPGIIFDTRSVLLSISGLFFGATPTVIAMAITAAFRFHQGGAAMPMGVTVILATGSLGILWRHRLQKPLIDLTGSELYLFGIIVHIVMMICAFVLPLDTALSIIRTIGLPVMLIYPVATLLLGFLLVTQLRREQTADDLYRSEARLKSTVEILQQPVTSVQEFLDFALEQAIRLTESEFGYIYLYSEKSQQFILNSISKGAMSSCSIQNYSTCYELAETGLWGEAVRQRKAIIVNNYPAENPLKKGYPEGHVKILNYLTIPVFKGPHIVAVVGVANKPGDYNKADVLQLTLLMDGVWKAVERKRAEEALRESEERYKTIIENLPNGLILIIDSDLQIQFCSGEGVKDFNHDVDDIAGKTIYEVFDPELAEKAESGYRKVLEGESVRFEGKHNGKDFLVNAAPLHDDEEKLTQILSLVFNITEQKQAETQLRNTQEELQRLLDESNHSRRALLSVVEDQAKAQEQIRQINLSLEQRIRERTAQLEAAVKELEAFSYSVSHDLRAPLRAVDGFSGALLNDYQGKLDELGVHYLQRIRDATQRMGQLIDDLLNLSRITRRELNRSHVNLSLIAQDIADELLRQNPDRHIEFDIKMDMMAYADPNLLKIAIQNLLDNACKFTRNCETATIEVGNFSQEDEHIYFVRDNGIGFDMAYADKLFTPFQRLHSMQEYPGTGIGLVIVQRIISRHGGRIWPEAAVDKGVTFYFTLGEIGNV